MSVRSVQSAFQKDAASFPELFEVLMLKALAEMAEIRRDVMRLKVDAYMRPLSDRAGHGLSELARLGHHASEPSHAEEEDFDWGAWLQRKRVGHGSGHAGGG